MKKLEEIISYEFKDKKLLETALTHSSYAKELGHDCECNERLEFLGDAFLDAIISEEIYKKFPNAEEGFLSRARASLVCEKTLANKAREMGIGELLLLGRGEEKTGGRKRESNLENAVEAVIGAIFLDSGYDEVKRVVLTLFEKDLKETSPQNLLVKDYKSALQESLQAEGISLDKVKYIDAGSRGPEHDKTFRVKLIIDNYNIAEAEGKSKKQAQQRCAEIALKRRNNVI